MSDADLSVEKLNGTSVLVLRGSFDVETMDELRKALGELLRKGHVNVVLDMAADGGTAQLGHTSHNLRRLVHRLDDVAADGIPHHLGHGTATEANHRRSRRHRFDHAESEWFVEIDQVQQGERTPQHVVATIRAHRSDILNLITVHVRLDPLLVVVPILNDASQDQPPL